jgi:hypothetical protein
MEHNVYDTDKLETAIADIPKRLAAQGHDIGKYLEHTSTTRGITLKTMRGRVSIPKTLIQKLMWSQDSVTDDDLKGLVVRGEW